MPKKRTFKIEVAFRSVDDMATYGSETYEIEATTKKEARAKALLESNDSELADSRIDFVRTTTVISEEL